MKSLGHYLATKCPKCDDLMSDLWSRNSLYNACPKCKIRRISVESVLDVFVLIPGYLVFWAYVIYRLFCAHWIICSVIAAVGTIVLTIANRNLKP